MLLRDWLEANNMSQGKLAAMVGCTSVMLNYLIRGRNLDVKISLLRKLHEATGIPESDLITDLLSIREALHGDPITDTQISIGFE